MVVGGSVDCALADELIDPEAAKLLYPGMGFATCPRKKSSTKLRTPAGNAYHGVRVILARRASLVGVHALGLLTHPAPTGLAQMGLMGWEKALMVLVKLQSRNAGFVMWRVATDHSTAAPALCCAGVACSDQPVSPRTIRPIQSRSVLVMW